MPFIHHRVSAYLVPEEMFTQCTFNMQAVRYRDATYFPLQGGEAWVFAYGVIIFWGAEDVERTLLLQQLNLSGALLNTEHQEHFHFEITEGGLKIQHDMIHLGDSEPLLRLSISHAIAQSLKLNEYEQQAQTTISQYAYLPRALAQTGKINLSRSALAKIRGHLFSTKSDIFLHYGLLGTPEVFLEYPEYEYAYSASARYLDISSRVGLLSNKLDVIHELFEMLADDLNHKHSSFLEWIIILLIAFEIATFGAEELKAIFM